MDIPDYLPGNPPMYGTKQEVPTHYQGDSIEIPVKLLVNPANYVLTAYIKDRIDNETILWTGNTTEGIEISNSGISVSIKATKARTIPSGIYYLAIVGATPKDIGTYTVLFQTTISITPAASSPLPVVKSVGYTGLPPSIPKDWIYTPITYFQ
jgi:hypothetical protein